MNVISHLISEKLINAFGWTIIHSIWQGAVVALGFSLLMLFMRRYSSRTRYFIGVLTLALILAMSMVTFVSVYHPGNQGNRQIDRDQSERSKVTLVGSVEIENLANPGKNSFFKDYFNRHLPFVVTVWFLGILVLVLRLAGGFLYNQRIKVHRTHPLSIFWQNRLKALCLRAGIQKSVRLVESALAKVPIVIGHFKPVILLPVGLVTGLPQDQVEALLAHELAHISRKDYLVNILQSFVDILFFYHPGVRWISSHIRSEREHCCDDIAVFISGGAINFARALTNIQGYGLKNASPAMAATGKTPGSYGLMNRIKRLVSPCKNKSGSEFTEGFIGASILGLCILILVASANAAAALNPNLDIIKTNIPVVNSKTDSQNFTLKMDANLEIGGKFKSDRNVKIDCRLVDVKTNQTVWLLKEDKIKKGKGVFSFKDKVFLKKGEYMWHVSKNCTDLFVSMTGKSAKAKEKIVSHMTFEDEMEIEDEEMVENEETMEKEVTVEAEEEMEIALEREEEELNSHEKEIEKALKRQEEELERRKAELKRRGEELKRREKEMEKALEKQGEELERRNAELKRHEKEIKKHDKEMKIALKKQDKKMKREMLKMEGKMRKVNKKLHKAGKKLKKEKIFLDTLKRELLTDKLIEDEENFEFKLTVKKLIINGKTQPRAIFEKYKKLVEILKGKVLKGSDKFHIMVKRNIIYNAKRRKIYMTQG